MYKYIFGPVPSRRLGMSLGIDLVPRKVCSLNCVYCEVGETTKLTTDRKEYVLCHKVIEELTSYLENNPAPDFITFSGYGEPTLNLKIGEVLQFIKENYPDIKIAVLTNGTLFYDRHIRQELMNADVVLPSLDAATDQAFQKINRPDIHLSVDKQVEGLIDFRNKFKGEIWLEIFILPGYNDHEKEIDSLKVLVKKINPDRLQLNTLDRPGAIEGIRPATREELEKIGLKLDYPNVEIIASALSRKTTKVYRDDTESTIMETIARRPCTVYDLRSILGLHVNEINKYLGVLEESGKITSEMGERGIFYKTT
ncbi:radical SAM protein [Thermophagus sp. OGC60D27]|uniref:radical SAM protein n=1 Tax=Thermophagus sp. OGC60D27 TaxID=3458415 RepID=UPI00403809FE